MHERLVGTLILSRYGAEVLTDNKVVSENIAVPPRYLRGAEDGDKVDSPAGFRRPPRHECRTPLLWEQWSRANRVRFCPSAFRTVSSHQFIAAFQPIRHASGKPVVSLSYSQSAAFAALASYSPSSGVQSSARTSVQRGARTHLGRDIVTS